MLVVGIVNAAIVNIGSVSLFCNTAFYDIVVFFCMTISTVFFILNFSFAVSSAIILIYSCFGFGLAP